MLGSSSAESCLLQLLPCGLCRERQCCRCGLPSRGQDADIAGCLLRIDFHRQVMGLRRCLEHFQGRFINMRVRYIQFQIQAGLQGIGPLYYYIQCVDAVDGDMPLCNHLSLGVVEINTDNNIQLRIQVVKPSPALAATLQLLALADCFSLIQSKHRM